MSHSLRGVPSRKILEERITALRLPARIENRLLAARIETVASLSKMSRVDLAKISRIGLGMAAEIAECLARYGIKIEDGPPKVNHRKLKGCEKRGYPFLKLDGPLPKTQ